MCSDTGGGDGLGCDTGCSRGVAAGKCVVVCIRTRQGTCYDIHSFTSCGVFIGEATAACEVDDVAADDAIEYATGACNGIAVIDFIACGDGTGDAFRCDVSSGRGIAAGERVVACIGT